MDRGELASALGSFQRAIEHQRAALRANPSNPTYREFLRNHYGGVADVLRKQGDHAGAARAAEEYARVSPQRGKDSVKAADALMRCQQLVEADARLSMADRQAKARDYSHRAATLLKDGFEAAGDDPETLNDLAWFLVSCTDSRLRDPARAVELARKAIARSPEAGSIWNTLGVAQYRARAWDQAIEALTRSMELTSGGSPADWFFLAMDYWHKGEKDKARSWYVKAVQWMEQHKSQDEDLLRFRAEAAALWSSTDHPDPNRKGGERPATPVSVIADLAAEAGP
jgi:tetratricopeptide (TPR) repeat protein